MLFGFIGRVSAAPELKEALDISSQRTRLIADRVAKASLGGADGFAATLETAAGAEGAGAQGVLENEEPVDLEREMVALADEQIRFETTARLLQRAYQNIRMSLRNG